MTAIPLSMKATKIALHLGGSNARRMLKSQNFKNSPEYFHKIVEGEIGWIGNATVLENQSILLFTGVPIGGPDVRQITDYTSAARLLREYEGAFAALFWDAVKRKLVIVTDFLGLQPLYWSKSDNGLQVATETKAFRGQPDLAAWGAFISLGQTIGDRSLMEGVARVPRAAVWIYDAATGALDKYCYWNWPEPRERVSVDDLIDPLHWSIREYMDHGYAGTLLLSGGFDSRLLLLMLRDAGIDARTLIVSHPEERRDADGRFAQAIAEALGVHSERVTSDRDFYSLYQYLDYLIGSDAGTPSLHLFIAQIDHHIHDAAVWEGVVPGVSIGALPYPGSGITGYLTKARRDWNHPVWRAARRIFRHEVCQTMYDGFMADLDRECARHPNDAYGMTRFFVENRTRHRTSINPLKVFANHALPFTPGMVRAHWDAAAAIPCDAKANNALYLQIYEKLYPDALRIPFVSMGHISGPGHHFNLTNNTIVMKLLRQLGRAPFLNGIANRLGITTWYFKPSRFLQIENLPGNVIQDRYIDPRMLAALVGSPGLGNRAAREMLFYWLTWHWVHEDRLIDVLSPFQVADPGRRCT
jgi:hypothetical protein